MNTGDLFIRKPSTNLNIYHFAFFLHTGVVDARLDESIAVSMSTSTTSAIAPKGEEVDKRVAICGYSLSLPGKKKRKKNDWSDFK